MAETWRPRSESTVALRDGRRLGYAEWGVPAGKPVLFCHGGAMSRLASIGGPAATRLGVRQISVELPGHGLSDPKPGWQYVDWADDVAELADSLGIDRFVVAGASAGTVSALACGYRLPERVALVGIAAGMVALEQYEPDEMSRRAAADPVAAVDFAREHLRTWADDIDASVAAMAGRPGPDGAVYAGPELQAIFRANRREAFRQGLDGAAYALVQMNRPWGFTLADVVVPVRYWMGDEDHGVTPEMLRTALDPLPNYTLTLYPGEGHTVGFTHGEEILAELAAAL